MKLRRTVLERRVDIRGRKNRSLVIWVKFLTLVWLACLAAGPAHAGGVRLSPVRTNLLDVGRLYAAPDEPLPPDTQALSSWLARHRAGAKMSLFGGSYWLYAEFSQHTPVTRWVLDPNNTLINRVEARVYAPDGTVQTVLTGYRNAHDYMLHYGKRIELRPDVEYRVLIHFSSPYFASYPDFDVVPERAYHNKVVDENIQIVGALGALLSLALFNLFIFVLARDASHVYYALYLLAYFCGWAFVFHIPAEVMGIHNLHLHYIPFFLLPVLNTLFYLHFLQLRVYFPRLATASRINLVLPLLLLPSCFFALSYAHALATLVISIWLVLALVSGIACWREGFRPARYFVFAFIALWIPGALILPANVGLMPDIVDNAELLTLLGGTLDALLLAFALADRIKLLNDEREIYLDQLDRALDKAHTDALTGIGNRYAFDLELNQRFDYLATQRQVDEQMLVLVDVDSLKSVNDTRGHAAGDTLLRTVAEELRALGVYSISCFRLGGDEFALLARKRQYKQVSDVFARIERSLLAKGFPGAGLSYGIAYFAECASPAELMNCSDERMYRHKSARRDAADTDAPKRGDRSAV